MSKEPSVLETYGTVLAIGGVALLGVALIPIARTGAGGGVPLAA